MVSLVMAKQHIKLAINEQTVTMPVMCHRQRNYKNLSLRVDAVKGVIVRGPLSLQMHHIHRFLDQQKEWLQRQFQRIDHDNTILFSVDMLQFMGEQLAICRHPYVGQRLVERVGKRLDVWCPDELLHSTLLLWLKREAAHVITAWVIEFCQKSQQSYQKLVIKDHKSRWGSCSTRGTLNFNWKLIFFPPAAIRYICAHEVAHLQHMNHSPAFWAAVQKLDPDYRQGQAYVHQHGRRIIHSVDFSLRSW